MTFYDHYGSYRRSVGNKKIEDRSRDLLAQVKIISLFAEDLARIFHTDRDEEAAKAYGIRQASILMPFCMFTYFPSQNMSLTQHPSVLPVSAVDRHEISGLNSIFHLPSYTTNVFGDVGSYSL